MSFEGYLFVVALPVAETVTFIIAGLFFSQIQTLEPFQTAKALSCFAC